MIRYLLLVNLYSGLLYLLYLALLKNRPRHSWSRYYLLLACLLPLALPFLQLTVTIWQQAGQPQAAHGIVLPELIAVADNTLRTTVPDSTWFFPAYSGIVLLLLMRLAFRFIRLQRFLSGLQFRLQGACYIAVNTGLGPASFGNKIIFPGTEIDPQILQHEQAHLRFYHYYDKTGMALLQCIFFPVLAFYFISRELEAVHEFEADATAATQPDLYARTLLSAHLGVPQLPLLQSFFHHPLKRRIMMLHQEKKPDRKRHGLLLGATAMIIAAALSFQSIPPAAAQDKKGGQQQFPDKIYTSVETVPQFPGGMPGMMAYLAGNIHYPEEARKKGIEGKVYLQFVVDKDGTITNVVLKRDIGGGCGDEAIRVVQGMPKWKPGEQNGQKVRVYYTLPVNFKLSK